MRIGSSVLLTSLLGVLAGCTSSPYACSDSSQCVNGDVAGVCQLSGYCSFPDEACASGQRYGDQAGGGLAGNCVPVDPNETDTEPGVTSTSESTASEETSAGVTSLGSESSADGSSGCTPNCTARECGDDGCGGTCGPGCADGVRCSEQGTCLDSCPSTWRVPHGSVTTHVSLDDDAELLVTGSDGPQGLVSRVSACDGQVLASTGIEAAGATSIRVTDAASTPTSWVVAGTREHGVGPRTAFLAQLDASDLTALWIQDLPEPMEEAWAVGMPEGDTAWVAGIADGSELGRAWAATLDMSGACGFPASVEEGSPSNAHALAVLDGFVYVAGSQEEEAYVAAFDAQACGGADCSCGPSWSLQFNAVGETSELQAMIAVDGALYAAGVGAGADNPNDTQGFVVRIDPIAASAGPVWPWNPSNHGDAIFDLAHRDGILYSAGMTNYDVETGQGQATILAIEAEGRGESLWETPLPEFSAATGIVVDDDAVFVVAGDAESGWVLRCTLEGGCSP